VCGPTRRLVEQVIDDVVARIGADAYDRVRLTSGETPERDIWAAIDQFPAGGPRLVVVREAERLERWEQLADWLEDRALKDSHVLFVSSEEATDTSLDHIHLIVTKGKFVKCGPYSPPSKKGQRDLRIDVLKARVAITEPAARLLLDRTRGDMDAALDFANKCRLFSGTVDERLVEAIVEVAPADNFVESVVAFRPREAFQALAILPEEDYSATIGMLDYQLDCLSRLYRALRKVDRIQDKGSRTREIIKQSRLEPWQVARFLPYARRYDPPQVRTCIEALAMADSKVAEGETDLVMELLVSLWMVKAA
jgi:DNA polymerase III delta subunit